MRFISCPLVWSPESGLGYWVESPHGRNKDWDTIPDQTRGQLSSVLRVLARGTGVAFQCLYLFVSALSLVLLLGRHRFYSDGREFR